MTGALDVEKTMPRCAEFGVVWLMACAFAVVVYLPHVIRGGWYSDDWLFNARFELSPSQSFLSLWHAAGESTSRPGHALLMIVLYKVSGSWPAGYLVMGALLAATQAWLVYVVMRLVAFPKLIAGAAGALLIPLPVIDSVRLWSAAYAAPVAVSLVLAGFALALVGLRSHGSGRAARWHAAACLCYFAGALTYEIVLPFIALSGLLYLVLGGGRPSIRRWAADVGAAMLAVALLAASGQAARKEPTFSPGYLWNRVASFWRPTREAFAAMIPGGAWLDGGLGVLLVGLAGATLGIAASRPDIFTPLVRRYVALVGAGAATWFAGLVTLVPASNYYVPRITGVGNRTLSASAVGGVLVIVGAAALGGLLAGSVLRRPEIAVCVTVAALTAAGINYVAREVHQQRAWHQSWVEATDVVRAVKTTLPALPAASSIVTFDHRTAIMPDDVPVFTSTWDLESALQLAYRDPTIRAEPWEDSMRCNSDGLSFAGRARPLGYGGLWFVSVADRTGWPVTDRDACQAWLATLLPGRSGGSGS